MTGGRFRSETVEDFLSNFPSSSTTRGYRCHLKCFFKVIDKDPEKYIIDIRRLENNDRLDFIEEYEKDVNKFWKWLIKNKYAPKTVSNATNCIRVFLKQYRIKLDEVVWDNIRKRGTGNKPVTQETPITKEMLKEILIHGDAKAKAMFLVLISGGMRIGELVKLKMSDVDTDSKPTKIIVRYDGPGSVKTKSTRISFISDEATVALREWLKQRTSALELAVKRTNFPNVKKQLENNYVFPFQANNVRNIWNGLIEKAGLGQKDERTGRYKVHIHGLRNYFRVNFSKYNTDIAEVLMGHEGYCGGAYKKYAEEELKKEYIKGMKHLLIFETSVDSEELKEMHKELEETKKQLAASNKRIDEVLNNPEIKAMFRDMILGEFTKLQQEKSRFLQ